MKSTLQEACFVVSKELFLWIFSKNQLITWKIQLFNNYKFHFLHWKVAWRFFVGSAELYEFDGNACLKIGCQSLNAAHSYFNSIE